jgi:CHASE3 domain sensor protein
MAVRIVFIFFLMALAQPVLAGDPALARHENIQRIQSAIGPGGVARVPISSAEVEQKLSRMSDAELHHLAEGLEQPNHAGNPMTIVLASLLLLVLVVMLVVALVE